MLCKNRPEGFVRRIPSLSCNPQQSPNRSSYRAHLQSTPHYQPHVSPTPSSSRSQHGSSSVHSQSSPPSPSPATYPRNGSNEPTTSRKKPSNRRRDGTSSVRKTVAYGRTPTRSYLASITCLSQPPSCSRFWKSPVCQPSTTASRSCRFRLLASFSRGDYISLMVSMTTFAIGRLSIWCFGHSTPYSVLSRP